MKTKQLIRYFVILFFPLFTFAFPKPDAISIFGNNPQVEVANVKQPEFEYRSVGTRTIGMSVSFDKRWFSLETTDPRDTKGNRSRHSLLEYRYFGDYQWGVVVSHSKNFSLYSGRGINAYQTSQTPDMEMYTTQAFVIKNTHDAKVSMENAFYGLAQIKESGFTGFYGLNAFTNYLHDKGSLASGRTGDGISDINNVNSHGIGAMGGGIGVMHFTDFAGIKLSDFFLAGQVALMAGTTYTSWTEKSGQGEKLNILQFNGSLIDLAMGYAPKNYTLLFKISTYSNMHNTKDYKLQSFVTNMGITFTYRF